ncbi:MAG: hypothetical protein ACRD12_18395, partial [Acidimicrobiales bacterium]
GERPLRGPWLIHAASLLAFHEAWAWVVIVGNGVAGLWALGAWRWAPLRTRALWWFTAFAEVAVFVQAGLGVGMIAGQDYPTPKLHTFYGFLGIIAVGIIYSYRQQMLHRLFLLYGFGGLFIMGLGIRALALGKT